MAVYTHLTEEEARAHVTRYYAIGEFVSLHGIAEGVENSNFVLKTTQGKYILTLFEKRTDPKDLPYFMTLMAHLAQKGIHCPAPILTRTDEAVAILKEKAAVIVAFVQGSAFGIGDVYELPLISQLGELVAQLHLAVADFPMQRRNALSLSGWKKLAQEMHGRLDEITPGLQMLVEQELIFLEKHWPENLPCGAIHADLFPDNIFFIWQEKDPQPKLTGVIDFYFACNDFFAYDLAITINAWCFNAEHNFSQQHCQQLLDAYQAIRPLNAREKAAMPILLRGAALRFLLTRAYDMLNQVEGAQVTIKNPLEYERKLRFFQRNNAVSTTIT